MYADIYSESRQDIVLKVKSNNEDIKITTPESHQGTHMLELSRPDRKFDKEWFHFETEVSYMIHRGMYELRLEGFRELDEVVSIQSNVPIRVRLLKMVIFQSLGLVPILVLTRVTNNAMAVAINETRTLATSDRLPPPATSIVQVVFRA